MKELHNCLGWQYWQKTAFNASALGSLQKLSIESGDRFKTYPHAERIQLPSPSQGEEKNLWEILNKRRSQRRFSENETVSLQNTTDLLWAAQGITYKESKIALRTAPSAGALYPVETYVLASRVQGVPMGVYHLHITDFCLEKVAPLENPADLASIALGQSFCSRAPLVFVFTAVFRRNMHKYGHRGLRYILMDVGHICQNLLLAATALGLKSCPVAAFFDDPLNNLLNIDGDEESSLYMVPAG